MYKFEEIVNIPKLQELMEAFYEVTGLCSAVLDPQGNILVAVGWQDICTKFHRQNPETCALCRKSDGYVNKHLDSGEPFISYTCLNGLFDFAAAIIIDGKHYANIYHGQVFTEEPNLDIFRERARKYGFNEEEYIEAVKKVPIVSLEKSKFIMQYLIKLGENMVETGMSNLKLLEVKTQELKESRFLLKILFDNTPNVAVRIFDTKFNKLYWNKTAKKIFSSSKTLENINSNNHFSLEEILNPILGQVISNFEEISEPIGPFNRSFECEDETIKYFYSTLIPLSYKQTKEVILMDVDVTEQKRMEKELARIGQLNIVGEMAASIGHEVRNPMTTVRGYLQLFAAKNDFYEFKEHFELMIQELDRANAIITEFLSLAKNKKVELVKSNLNSIILSLSPLIEARALINNLELKLELGEIQDILLDEQEIRQLIINIAHNGLDAMPSGGTLKIKTYNENNVIVMAVEDQGEGIAPEVMDKLGTPFHTTKENGTGLGLAVCFSIADRHKANISIQSSQRGAIFYVRFKS